MSKPSRCFYLLALLSVGLLLTGCEDSSERIAYLEELGTRPIWEKVTAIALATLISEDLACLAAGLLVSEHALSLGWAIFAGFIGIFLGDIALYALGRFGGKALLGRAPFRWFLKPERIVQAEQLFLDHAGKLILSSRLLPGSRVAIYTVAGMLRYPFGKFCFLMFLVAILSAIILVPLAWKLGEVIFEWLRLYELYVIPSIIGVLLLIWLAVTLFELLATRRRRHIFLARMRRIRRKLRGQDRTGNRLGPANPPRKVP
jgi:membrane protein DedA with SNARE-associated domain